MWDKIQGLYFFESQFLHNVELTIIFIPCKLVNDKGLVHEIEKISVLNRECEASFRLSGPDLLVHI